MSEDEQSQSLADVAWARKHGWAWDGCRFVPDPWIKVIQNPISKNPGWVIWLKPSGAIQTDAPYGSLRAALRVAEAIRRGRSMGRGEMSCVEEADGY